MNVITKFLDTYNYKFKAGVFNPNDKDDLLLLEQILGKLNEATDLRPTELKKTAGKNKREILIKKITNNEPLTKVDGGEFLVYNKEKVIKTINSWDEESEITLEDIEGNKITTKELLKTKEFGGQPPVTTLPTTANLKPSADTPMKEGLVVLMYNVLKGGGKLTIPVDYNLQSPKLSDNFNKNIKILNDASNSKWEGLDSDTISKIQTLLDSVKNITLPPQKTKQKLDIRFNNPYSIAKVLNEAYPKAKVDRDKYFIDIRTIAGDILQMPDDKWNPGDIYLLNGDQKSVIDKAVSYASENSTIQPINALFTNTWGGTEQPLVSISLKEEKYQEGRAKSYLDKFGSDYNMDSSETEVSDEVLKEKIKDYRKEVKKLLEDRYEGKGNTLDFDGDGWGENGKFPTDPDPVKQKRSLVSKYGAYKLLKFLLIDDKASLKDLFSYGLSLDQDLKINPTFWKLVGKKNGSSASKYPYPAGTTTALTPDSTIIIQDNSSNANVKLTGNIDISTKEGTRSDKTSKTFRTSGEGQVQIL